MDLANLTRAEIDQLIRDATTEGRARDTVAQGAERAAHAARQFLAARDRHEAQPAPWVAPTGAHDLYPQGYVVTHEGATWESANDANGEEPGTSDAWVEPS